MTAPPVGVLVIGVGNPSRGDDALGPAFVERVGAALAAEMARGELELLTDFQLQVEHALDLQGRARVVFVDASVSAAAPFTYAAVAPALGPPAYTTHAMSPAALLATYRDVVGAPPPAFVLAIRGEAFELGAPLSAAARAHLDAALAFFAASARPAEARHA